MPDSDLSVLDRRLQVDRVLGLDPLQPVAPSTRRQADAFASLSAPATGPATTATAERVIDRLPLGDVVVARVVEVPHPDRVVAEIDGLRFAMAWPAGPDGTPRAGSDIALRVLAHRPVPLFQTVTAGVEATLGDDAEGRATWSDDALRLQRSAPGDATRASSADGVLRFDQPILGIGPDVDARSSSSLREGAVAPDHVVVAAEAKLDGPASPARGVVDDGMRTVAPSGPFVLHGPAWDGRPVELVVRRERADEQFDNPALDRWCGELTIDLPSLGRVAGHLTWSMQGLRIRMEGDGPDAIAAMNTGAAELAAALADVDLRVAALSVGGPSADSLRAGETASSAPTMSFARATRG